MQAIAAHTSALARYLHTRLLSLRHGTGEPVLRFFGGWEKEEEEEGSKSVSVSGHRLESMATVPQDAGAGAAGVAVTVMSARLEEGRVAGKCGSDKGFSGQDDRAGAGAGAGPRPVAEKQGETGDLAEAKGEWIQGTVASRRNRSKSSLFVEQGPVLAMAFLRPGGDEKYVGHAEVEKIAGLENIQLRTGCFCNPGACQAALGLTDDDVREHLER